MIAGKVNPNPDRRNTMKSAIESKVFYYALTVIVAAAGFVAQARTLLDGVGV